MSEITLEQPIDRPLVSNNTDAQQESARKRAIRAAGHSHPLRSPLEGIELAHRALERRSPGAGGRAFEGEHGPVEVEENDAGCHGLLVVFSLASRILRQIRGHFIDRGSRETALARPHA